MKRLTMAILIGLLVCSSTILAEARSERGSYYNQNTEIKRIDNNTLELAIDFTNTTNKPINNVILMLKVTDTNRIRHEPGFLFLGQLKPNVRKSYRVRIDAPYKYDDYYIFPRVLQNDDLQLEEGAVYPVNYFNQYIEADVKDIYEENGLGYFTGSLTNISSIPIKRLHFDLLYLDSQKNPIDTRYLQWTSLNVGETKPYRFGRVLPKSFDSADWRFFPIEPGYGAAE